MSDQERIKRQQGLLPALLEALVIESIDAVRFIVTAAVASLIVYGLCLGFNQSVGQYLDQAQEYAASNDIIIVKTPRPNRINP